MKNFLEHRFLKKKDSGYWKLYEGKGPLLDDGAEISRFGFMTKNDATSPPVVFMDISASCIDLQAVKQVYPQLFTNNSAPSAHSHRVGYQAQNEDGEFSFFFNVEAAHLPYCLAEVGFTLKRSKYKRMMSE